MLAEATRLGLGEPVAISAETGALPPHRIPAKFRAGNAVAASFQSNLPLTGGGILG